MYGSSSSSERAQQQRGRGSTDDGDGVGVVLPPQFGPLQPQEESDAAGYGSGFSRDLVSEELHHRAVLVALTALFGLVSGVFVLVAGGPEGSVAWVTVATLAAAGMFLVIRKFEMAMVLFMAVAWIAIGTPSLAKGGSGVGKNIMLSQVGLVALLTVWLMRLLASQRFRLYRMPLNLPILIFLAVCVWSTINGILLPDARAMAFSTEKQYLQVNILELAIRFLALGAVLMIGNTLSGRMLRAAACMIAVPGILTFSGLLPFIPASQYLAFPQIIAMSVLASMAVTAPSWPRWARFGAGVIAAAIFGVYFLRGTVWLSGWMGALVSLAVMLFLVRRRVFWMGVAALAVGVLLNWGYFYQQIWVENFETVSSDRFKMLYAAVLYAANFPLGIGLGNYRTYNAYYGRPDVWNTTAYSSAHGTYAQALSETGWPGLLALLFLLGSAIYLLWRTYHRLEPGWQKSYVLAALGSFVGISFASLAGDYMFPAYHNGGMGSFGACVYLFLMLGVVVAIARENGIAWYGEESAPEPVREEGAVPDAPAVIGPVYNRPVRVFSATPDAAALPSGPRPIFASDQEERQSDGR